MKTDNPSYQIKVSNVEHLFHSEKTVESYIGLYLTADKTECVTYSNHGSIIVLSINQLKRSGQFIYLGSDIDSPESVSIWAGHGLP